SWIGGGLLYHRAMSQEAIPGNGHEPDRPLDTSSVPPGSGPDDALILWMLSLTSTERLAVAQGFVDSTYALRNGQRS
ncbi:MAG TPA: hypothetical protein VEG34_18430, partial [Thermoanaerobaculia bacterium]|nr:hypothetical protein [Thermoanaerobaculia bacterium]